MQSNKWRLLLSGKNDGPTNMAIDEALFLSGSKEYAGNLRFYFWETPTISLGYFQKVKEILDLKKCEKLGINVVRRITGGGAIYHFKEITYSITSSLPNPVIAADVGLSYKILKEFIIRGINDINIPVSCREEPVKLSSNFYCFMNPTKYDIVNNGKKIVGSAQRRNKSLFLQHGSILMNINDIDKMFSVFKDCSDKHELMEKFKKKVIAIEDISGRRVTENEVIERLVNRFSSCFNAELIKDKLTTAEQSLVCKLIPRYKFPF